MRRKVILNKKIPIILCSVMLLALVFPTTAVFAKYNYSKGNGTGSDKIVAKNINDCYGSLKSPIVVQHLIDYVKYRSDTDKNKIMSGDPSVMMPNYMVSGTSSASPSMKCSDFLFGNNDWGGIIKVSSSDTDAEGRLKPTSAGTILEKLGYTKSGSGATELQACLRIRWAKQQEVRLSNKLCAKILPSNNNINYVTELFKKDAEAGEAGLNLRVRDDGTDHYIMLNYSDDGSDTIFNSNMVNCNYNGTCVWEDTIVNGLNNKIDEYGRNGEIQYSVEVTQSPSSSGSDDATSLTRYVKDGNNAVGKAIENYTGINGGYGLTPSDLYNIYLKYITDSTYVELICGNPNGYNYTEANGWHKLTLKNNGSIEKECYARKKQTGQQTRYTGSTPTPQNSANNYLSDGNLSLEDIINRINKIGDVVGGLDKITGSINDVSAPYGTEDPGGGGDPDQTASTCHATAGAMGWVLCPVLEFAADAAQWSYANIIEPSLHTNPKLFEIDGDRNGTFQAWSIFRNIANILFAILLLFVILSQVSGIGIDNYGIKKILPKLIISALLINVSFFICQALIDLSNVIGNGVYGLLNGISSSIQVETETIHMDNTGSIVMGILLVVAGVTVGARIGGAAFWSVIGQALLAFVPILLSAAAAILFLFALLAVRQAVVVILVALSPLVFVAYTLPNTKKIFDRWSQMLRGMLLLYPISAVLVAGGRLASRIIFASGAGENNLGIILTAMAAEIVPLFFIPTVVRSAYNATGHLGATLNNLHGRTVGRTREAVRRSQRFQRANQRQQYRRANQALNGRFMRRYRRAAASSNPIAQAYARWATGRAGAIQQNANQLAAQQGALAGWANAQSGSPQEAYNQAKTKTEQQLINQANYGSAQFNAAVIKEATSQADDARKRQLMWNSTSYVAGKEAEALTARQNEAANAVQYGTPGYADRERLKNQVARDRAATENATWDSARVTAEKAKAAEEARSQRENVLLYNETGFGDRERSKNQTETNRRRVENATWSDARRDAVTEKARIEAEAQKENDLLYDPTTNPDFGAREEERHKAETEKRKIENESWTPDRAKGEIRKAKVDAKAQRENAELYKDEDFATREEKRNETQTEIKKIENAAWTEERAEGEKNAAEINAGEQAERAKLYNNEEYRKGKISQNKLSRRNDEKTATLYARDDYRASREKQQDITISNETTKMYSDQFSRMSMPEVMKRLQDAISDGTTQDRTEQYAAAATALIQTGQVDKLREIVTGGKVIGQNGDGTPIVEHPEVAVEFGKLIQDDKEFRDRTTQILGSSGEFMFQEYAKHVGKSTIDVNGHSNAMSFDKWVRSSAGIGASVTDKGIGRFDKDDYKYLATDKAARDVVFSKAPAEDISKSLTTSDKATITEATKTIIQLDEAKRHEVIRATSADRAATMSQEVRDALAGIRESDSPETRFEKNKIWRDQIGKAIRDNPQIAARFNENARKAYIDQSEDAS